MMRQRCAGWTASLAMAWMGCVTSAGCGAPAEPTHPQASSSSTAAPRARGPEAPPPQFVLSQAQIRATGRIDLPDGNFGILHRGGRYIVGAQGGVVGSDDGARTFNNVEAVPAQLGGGYLFHVGDGLYLAKASFLEAPQPVFAGSVASTSFGPGFVFVTRDDGQRVRVPLGDGKTPIQGTADPLGAVEFAIGAEGISAALIEGGRLQVTKGAGAVSWIDVTSHLGAGAVELVSQNDAVFVRDRVGGTYRVKHSDIVAAPIPAFAAKTLDVDPRWRAADAPLDAAVRAGASIGQQRALVASEGSVFTVSTKTGAIEEVESGVLPPDGNCEAHAMPDVVLFICPNNRGSVFRRPYAGGPTKLEKSFSAAARFHRAGRDALLFAGPCQGEVMKEGIACLRKPDGSWIDVDITGALSDQAPGEVMRLLTWIPTAHGAFAVLGSANHGGILNAMTMSRSTLEKTEAQRLAQIIGGARATVEHRFRVIDDGTIEGWGADNLGVRIADGGKRIDTSPFRFTGTTIHNGPRALATGPRGGLWQSTDWGWTFTEVETPPVSRGTEPPRACSEVGCTLGPWLRLGWEARPPAPQKPPVTSPSVAAPARAPLPSLRCTSTGAVARRAFSPNDATRAGFGAESIRTETPQSLVFYPRAFAHPLNGGVESQSLRALLSGPIPAPSVNTPTSSFNQPRRIRFIEPFDPKAAVKDSTIRLSELFEAVRSGGGAPPDVEGAEERGIPVPVLGESGGVVLSSASGPLIWARTKGKPMALTLGPDASDLSLSSAIETGPDELTVLAHGYDYELFVRVLGRGRADSVFSIPPPPAGGGSMTLDSLARGADGSFAVVRVPTAYPPTREDPAFLLRPGAPPVALAPWSTIVADGTAPCEGMRGHRMIVQTRQSWLATGPVTEPAEAIMLARVRWNEERVCLEAVEAHALTHTLDFGTFDSTMVARFGKDAAGGHVMVSEGAELREPRSCTLGPPAIRP